MNLPHPARSSIPHLALAAALCCTGPATAATTAAPPKAAATAAKPAAPAKPRKARPPVAKSVKPEPAPPPDIALPEASTEQIGAAEQVYYGIYDCEFKQTINIVANPKHFGYVDVKHGKADYLMKPVLSSTGAIRLEDVRGETLMVQIAAKSMLLNVKTAQRVVDECVSPKQRELMEAARAAKAAAAAEAAAGGASAPAASTPGTAALPLLSAPAQAPAPTPGPIPAPTPAPAPGVGAAPPAPK